MEAEGGQIFPLRAAEEEEGGCCSVGQHQGAAEVQVVFLIHTRLDRSHHTLNLQNELGCS